MSSYIATVRRAEGRGSVRVSACVIIVRGGGGGREEGSPPLSPHTSVNSKRTKQALSLCAPPDYLLPPRPAIKAHRCSSRRQPVNQTHKQPRLPRKSAKVHIAPHEAISSAEPLIHVEWSDGWRSAAVPGLMYQCPPCVNRKRGQTFGGG